MALFTCFFLDYPQSMPKLLGYNRWPRLWPPHIPLWTRYPIVMDNAGTWPYEWKIVRKGGQVPWPPGLPTHAIATYDFTEGDLTVWHVLPTLVGGLTTTFLRIRLLGSLEAPTEYERSFSFLQETTTHWVSEVDKIPWHDNAGTPGGRQKQVMNIGVRSDGPPSVAAAFECSAADYCGQEWPPTG